MIKLINLIGKFFGYVKVLFLTSLVAFLISSFYTMYHFHVIAPVAVFANLIAVPFFSFFIMPLCTLILFLLPINGAEIPLQILDQLYFVFKNISQFFDSWDWNFMVGAMPSWTLGFFSFSFYFFIAFNNKWVKRFCVFVMLLCFASPLFYKTPNIWIAENGQLIAVKKEDGRLQFFGNVSLNKFIADEWIRINGQENILKSEKNYCSRKKFCYYQVDGKTLYILNDFFDIYRNIMIACDDENGIIVSSYEINNPACKAQLIDKKYLQDNGYQTF